MIYQRWGKEIVFLEPEDGVINSQLPWSQSKLPASISLYNPHPLMRPGFGPFSSFATILSPGFGCQAWLEMKPPLRA